MNSLPSPLNPGGEVFHAGIPQDTRIKPGGIRPA